jgi:hypothetical protein
VEFVLGHNLALTVLTQASGEAEREIEGLKEIH